MRTTSPGPSNEPTTVPSTATEAPSARCTTALTGPACHDAPVTQHGPVVLADIVRNGFVEGTHFGHAVIVTADGQVERAWGDPRTVIFPRSSSKPGQATAMVHAGLDLPPELLALTASSHSGEQLHLDGVARILAGAGLEEDALQTPLDLPLDSVERDSWIRQGRAPRSIAMNCSGKHASMLATCRANDWSTHDYLDPRHPLQQVITLHLAELSGEPTAHLGVDGCGAPVLAMSITGLARSVSQIVRSSIGSPGHRVATAMRAEPERVGGSRRDVTALMRRVPGLVAKDGAEGVYVVALADGRAGALKVCDGSDRARIVACAALLVAMGVEEELVAEQRELPVVGGGRPVGRVRSSLT
jgi:L-asparaginase II